MIIFCGDRFAGSAFPRHKNRLVALDAIMGHMDGSHHVAVSILSSSINVRRRSLDRRGDIGVNTIVLHHGGSVQAIAGPRTDSPPTESCPCRCKYCLVHTVVSSNRPPQVRARCVSVVKSSGGLWSSSPFVGLCHQELAMQYSASESSRPEFKPGGNVTVTSLYLWGSKLGIIHNQSEG